MLGRPVLSGEGIRRRFSIVSCGSDGEMAPQSRGETRAAVYLFWVVLYLYLFYDTNITRWVGRFS
jgi:hypothetical protein